METSQIVALLLAERERLNRAIEALQGPAKLGRRPAKKSPAHNASLPASTPAKTKRRKFSAAQREAAAERMRQRWATKRKADAKPSARKKAAKAA